ncbi:MAG TPA: hypothetical protein PKA27_09715 [Fimbriimonadaceae bacterium]|nr:hypothetical protein [Fimbriimonadaceae bacterium]
MGKSLLCSLVVASLALVNGCATTGSAKAPMGSPSDLNSSAESVGGGRNVEVSAEAIQLVAVDTSSSALPKHRRFFEETVRIFQRAPSKRPVYLYRFDSKPAEVFAEPPPGNRERVAQLLNEVLEHRSNFDGTNLTALLVLINKQVAALDGPVQVTIMTDCGVEKMSNRDDDQAKRITAKWAEGSQVQKLTLLGVADGHREKLRELIQLPQGKRFEILR